jgi:murein DD-endopeptidase MepM/ murein hydrolase activator NlpD
MERKFFTVLIFPGAHGRVHKIQLPIYAVYALLAFSLVGAMTVAVLASTYTRMLLKVSNYNSLRADREILISKYKTLEKAASQTNAKLGSLESLAAEVALSYGFGGARQPQFHQTALALATEYNSTLEVGYRASLYAFRLMRNPGISGPSGPADLGLDLGSRFDRTTVPSIWPVRGPITAGFGQRMDPFSGEGAFHAGVDISAPYGAQVESSADGIVFYAGPDQGYGKEVLINHGNGITSKYGHLSQIYVLVGQQVKRGELIGAVGMTGKATGPHLHYEVLVQETPVNPAKYLRG